MRVVEPVEETEEDEEERLVVPTGATPLLLLLFTEGEGPVSLSEMPESSLECEL